MIPDRPLAARRTGPGAADLVTYGHGSIDQVPAQAAALGADRILLVCGRRSLTVSGAARILPALEGFATVDRFDDVAPNTHVRDLTAALGRLHVTQPDLIIGIGGGSVLDLAKLLIAFDGVDRDRLAERIMSQTPTRTRRRRLLLAPTTSGSGAEATRFAVVYLDDEKYSVGGEQLRPDAIVLDPELTRSTTGYQRATSGIDAVAQAIESLWAVDADVASQAFARRALRMLLPAIERFTHDPDDRTAAGAMMVGSHLAGRAIDRSKTTASHALSYAITMRYGISHGQAVALSLGWFLQHHGEAPVSRLHPDLDAERFRTGLRTALSALGADSGCSARSRFIDLLQRLGLASDLAGCGVDVGPDEIQCLVERVNHERLGNNPVLVDSHELAEALGRSTAPDGRSKATRTGRP